MPKERDPFRKHVEYVKKNEWKCLYCGNKYRGSATRIRAHLAGIPGKGIKGCKKVDNLVRAEASQEKKGEGSGLDKSTGGTSGKGTEGTVFGTGQSVLPRDDASNPNDTQNPNQLRPTGTGTAPACPQDQFPLPPDDMPPDNLDNTQQSDPSNRRLDAAHGNENASSIQQLPMDSSASPSLDFSELRALLEPQTHLESETEEQNAGGLSSFPNYEVCGNSMSIGEYPSLDEHIAHGITPDSLLDSTCWSDFFCSLPENLPESLEDCGQPCIDELVPVRSNTSPTDAVQHTGQLPPRCDKEDGNDIRQFPSRTPMDIDPSNALQHSSGSHIFEATTVDSLVPEASSNPIGPSLSHASVPPRRQSVPYQSTNLETAHQNPTVPSSSQAPNNAPPPPQILPCGTDLTDPSSLPDMNEGAPITSHRNTGNNFGESSASKRKLELLYIKEAIVRDGLEFAASLPLKKPRMEVVNWLANVEMLRNDCSEDCLPSNQPVDILLHEVEDLMRQGKGLFEVRETKCSKLLEEKMVGEAFKRNTMKILEYLEGNQISPLGIYGMGGVGKTTIMLRTHNRLLEKKNNGKVLWITVSQDFNTQRLQDTIAEELKLDNLPKQDVRRRAAMLCDCLMKSGKFTVILDDVWKHFDLKEVGIPDKADNIKLVLTTRSLKVCCQMQCEKKIRIEPLSHTEAESLFLEKLGSEVTLGLETRPVMESIVRECAGLPLAIITMARSMRGVTDVFEWKDYLEKLRESNMGETDMETQVLMKLEFSYKCLDNYEIQQCFLSCALYPEDELIDKFELIEFFIDQGLIDQLSTREKQYNRGNTILNKLQNVCLLENHGSTMKMHDLIRDMALHVMSVTSIVKVGKGLRRIPSEEYWTDALKKVSLIGNCIEEFPLKMSPNCPKLSILLLNSSFICRTIPDSFFRQLSGLKVLNLSEGRFSSLHELPGSISDLVNLRALLVRSCWSLRRFPYLGKLISLRKLDISGSFIVEAPEGLKMLVNLTYLDLSATRINRLPEGTLGALRNLQYLKSDRMNLGDITELQELETLGWYFEGVDDFNKFVRGAFERGKNPRCYDLKVGKDFWEDIGKEYDKFRECERKVRIKVRCHAIVSVGAKINCRGVCILIPQDVQALKAINCDRIKNLSGVSLLENLEKLMIAKSKNLSVVLSGGQNKEIIDIRDSPAPAPTPLLFPSLRLLIIRECRKLKYLFGGGSKFHLPYLRKIVIDNCQKMVGITSPPPQPAPNLPSLEQIKVMKCDKMKRVVESEWLPYFPNLRYIKLRRCKNMEEIIRGSPPYMPVEEISLKWLSVEKCYNMRRLFSHEWLLHLRNLQSIWAIGCEGMVEMISGVGQDQEGSITKPINNTPPSSQSSISLPELKGLWLYDLPQLKSICEVPITCYSIAHLVVLSCPQLNRIPLQLPLRDIEDLPSIIVESEEMWKMLIWDHPNTQDLLQSHFHIREDRYFQEGWDSLLYAHLLQSHLHIRKDRYFLEDWNNLLQSNLHSREDPYILEGGGRSCLFTKKK